VLARLLNHSAATLDRAVSGAITGRSKASRARSKAESLGHAARMDALAAIRRVYTPHLEGDAFFGAPEARRFVVEDQGKHRARETYERLDVRWESRVEPACSDVRESHLATRENHRAAARLFRGRGGDRPLVILIHGYRAG